MTEYLLDTNIPSELRRPNPALSVTAFFSAAPLAKLRISVITLAEIRFGIESMQEPERRALLEQWLAYTIRPMFEGRVMDVTENVMLRWRHLVEHGRKTGHTHAQPDLLIAATALEHGLVLVTRNVKDFTGINLPTLNPWHRGIVSCVSTRPAQPRVVSSKF